MLARERMCVCVCVCVTGEKENVCESVSESESECLGGYARLHVCVCVCVTLGLCAISTREQAHPALLCGIVMVIRRGGRVRVVCVGGALKAVRDQIHRPVCREEKARACVCAYACVCVVAIQKRYIPEMRVCMYVCACVCACACAHACACACACLCACSWSCACACTCTCAGFQNHVSAASTRVGIN